MSRPSSPRPAKAPARSPASGGRWRLHRDWGGIAARSICALFALLGLLPLTAGALVRLERVQRWAALTTSDEIAKQLGVDARYQLELSPWPLELSMRDVVVAASDGGGPFLRARRVVARPRIFSLLAGKVDLGQVEIEEPVLRAVVKRGKLVNLDYRLPESSPGSGEAELPLSAVSLTNARIDLTIDDTAVRASQIDVDVVVDDGPLELSLRAGRTEVDRRHPDPSRTTDTAVDEDVLCSFELRARIADDRLRVRHLLAAGAADLDPAAGTRPSCTLHQDDWRRLRLEVTDLDAHLKDGALSRIDGALQARLPVPLVHRAVALPPTTGWVELRIDESYWDRSQRLPSLRGTVRAGQLGIDTNVIAHRFASNVELRDDVIHLDTASMSWAGGVARIATATISPLAEGAPLVARNIVVDGVELDDMLDDLSSHPHAHVAWNIEHTTVDRFGGTLSPLALSGRMKSSTRDFAVYDRPTTDPARWRMMGVAGGNLTGTFMVTPRAIVLRGFDVVTARSRLHTTVSLGFEEDLGIDIYQGSIVDLADISPLVDIEMGGRARVELNASGKFDDPLLRGELSVEGFDFAGFPIGNVTKSKFRFAPLELELLEAEVTHDKSRLQVPRLSLDFADGDADVVLDGHADTRAGGLAMRDLLEMLRLDKDPHWRDVKGLVRGQADIHFVLGGRRDRCGGGRLFVHTDTDLTAITLFGEDYDSGAVSFDYLWDDIPAGDRGLSLQLRSAVLNKGGGTVVAQASIEHGGKLRADVTGSSIALSSTSAFRGLFGDEPQSDRESGAATARVRPEAQLNFTASVGGTLDRLQGEADVGLSRTRIGPDVLPVSRFSVAIVPTVAPSKPIGRSRCGNEVMPPFDEARYRADPLDGVFRVAGELFAGQVSFDDLEITQQRAKMMSGKLTVRDLDLGALANLLPGVAFSAQPPDGKLSAEVYLDELPLDDPGLAEVRTFIHGAELERGGSKVRVRNVTEPVVLSGDALRFPTMPLEISLASGPHATVTAVGSINNLSAEHPGLALNATLAPLDLAELGVDISQISRAAGRLRAAVKLEGTTAVPRLSGELTLHDGMVRLVGFPLPIDDIDVDVRIREGEVMVRRATARVGNAGMVSLNARLPMRGLSVESATATLVARDLDLPLADGVEMTANALLRASYRAPREAEKGELPLVTGTVSLTQFSYTRPMSFTLDLDQLTGKAGTDVDTYDPRDDSLRFDVKLVSPRPLRLANNLIDMRLQVGQPGLELSGTDQRFGARGSLKVAKGSKLFLQGHDFHVDEGTVTFDDPKRIAPRLDVHATTEYRRYAQSSEGDAASASATTATAASSSAGGKWRIHMHAYGDTDEPKVRFTSDPPLSQEDIVLLLQVGMTRAELDRGLAGSLAQTVGIEALSAVTGLDQAVQKTVPLIDEFRVGSQYSSRSGRPEPTVSVGKRVTDRVRASVTTGLSETREVRANLEWKLDKGVSVQGSYDNVNDVSSSSLGNVGADLRWRLEFE